ncbi:hypothetical protein BKA83DRAFT_1427821 [Pisolithus microcarpus]|nr:hypothetical protein BKA83DRAFT_1427821 [Pisolithus microcarpus]
MRRTFFTLPHTIRAMLYYDHHPYQTQVIYELYVLLFPHIFSVLVVEHLLRHTIAIFSLTFCLTLLLLLVYLS